MVAIEDSLHMGVDKINIPRIMKDRCFSIRESSHDMERKVTRMNGSCGVRIELKVTV